MSFRLVDSGWHRILDKALAADRSRVRVICPFIKEKSANRLLAHGRPKNLEVITRYNLDCFRDGVSDIAALRLLLKAGAKIRGVKNLHAKAYLIGNDHAIVTSANLTEQGLTKNHEFGFYAADEAIAIECHDYFKRLWKQSGPDLTLDRLERWDRRIFGAWVTGAGVRSTPSLGDEGKDVGLPPDAVTALPQFEMSGQGFVKFFGEGHNRESHSLPVLEEVKRSGCHWACSYPAGKRPRMVRDGAVIFMGRLVEHPKDTLVFGRAIGMHYVPGRDDASRADIRLRPRKAAWPRYIRVRSPRFIEGTLENGVSLNEMMNALGSNSFAPTKRHSLSGRGNTNPQASLMQKAAMELTPEAIAWLDRSLERCFRKHGQIPPSELDKLDWPKIKL